MNRITHKDVERACANYNKRLRLTYRGKPKAGYLQWADIRGDGTNRRGLYVTLESGGVVSSDLRRRTMRATIAAINEAARIARFDTYTHIIRATSCTGEVQRQAVRALYATGSWLSDDQIAQGGMRKTLSGYPVSDGWPA